MAGLAVAALLLPGRAASAETGVEVDRSIIASLDLGLSCPLRVIASEDAPGTENGRVDIFDGELSFVDSGQMVPAVLGMSFGVRAWMVEGAAPMTVTVRSLHPAFPGTGTTSQSFSSQLGPDAPMSHIFTFDLPREATPGLWQLQALAGDQLVYSVPFRVVPPAEYTGPSLDCDDPDMLSINDTHKSDRAA